MLQMKEWPCMNNRPNKYSSGIERPRKILMNIAIKQQIQAKFDKHQSIKSRINRYPQWMMAFHEGIPGCDYSSEDLHRISQQTQKLFGFHAVDAFFPSRIRELAKYTQVSSPLVFLRDNTVSNQMEFHLMNKYHGLVTLSSRRYEANLRSIFSDSVPEDVCSPFIESQKILENGVLGVNRPNFWFVNQTNCFVQ